jgi:hypothetical protein
MYKITTAVAIHVVYTVELHGSGIFGTTCHPDMQKARIIGIFSENRLHWQFEVGRNFFYNRLIRIHI